MFRHEKLAVYQRLLTFASDAADVCAGWDSRHAIVDHLSRAIESVLANLAEGCRARAVAAKCAALDCSLGSVLECAACLDVAAVKSLLSDQESLARRRDLSSVFGSPVGLRNSWRRNGLCEAECDYVVVGQPELVFSHERLDVYAAALDTVRRLTAFGLTENLSAKYFRRVDQLATSIVLNIAEGNGRYSERDHRRFLRIANQSAVKLATVMDVGDARGDWAREQASEVKALLERVARMTAAMDSYDLD